MLTRWRYIAVENILRKGEIACNKQFLLFTQSFLSYFRILARNQIHWDKWPTDFNKGGPFQKIWGPSELPVYDANGLSAFRQVEKT